MRLRLTLIIVPIILFIILAILIESGYSIGAEISAYKESVEDMNPILTSIMETISNIGAWWSITGIALLLIIIPATCKKWGIPVAVTLITACCVNFILKISFERARPHIHRLVAGNGYSFPSGHSMNNIALYTILTILIWRYFKSLKTKIILTILCVALTFGIGFSRIYLGVHYAGDVLGGWLMGFSLAILMDTILNRKKIRNKATHTTS